MSIGTSRGSKELMAAAEPLLIRCASWTPRSWRHKQADGRSRADAAFAVVTALADLAADVEGRPHRPVPRLDDLGLPDQLAVMVNDVVRTGDDAACKHARTILRGLARSFAG